MAILYYKTYKMSRSLFFFLKKLISEKMIIQGMHSFLLELFFYKDDSIILFPFQL